MSNWIEVHADKVQEFKVRFLDEKQFAVGFFDNGYMVFACNLDNLDGPLYDNLRQELKERGEATAVMFLDLG